MDRRDYESARMEWCRRFGTFEEFRELLQLWDFGCALRADIDAARKITVTTGKN